MYVLARALDCAGAVGRAAAFQLNSARAFWHDALRKGGGTYAAFIRALTSGNEMDAGPVSECPSFRVRCRCCGSSCGLSAEFGPRFLA
jgi:hypothetical protein